MDDTLADYAKTGDIRAAAVTRSSSGQPSRRVHTEDLRVGSAAPLPTADDTNVQMLKVAAESGELLEVQDQVHMYAPNNLLIHPLVSPALSYLGGLPPMLVIAGARDTQVPYSDINLLLAGAARLRWLLHAVGGLGHGRGAWTCGAGGSGACGRCGGA